MARDLAVRHNLVCDDGTIVCWECRTAEALLPSLHCWPCLLLGYERAEAKRAAYCRANKTEYKPRPAKPQCPQRAQNDDDRRKMKP